MARILIVLLCFIPVAAWAQGGPGEADLRRHIEILASDEFAGREPGTDGAALAANYIALAFAGSGLEPAEGDNFFEPVPLVERSSNRIEGRWVSGQRTLRIDRRDLAGFGRSASEMLAEVPLIFVGFGEDFLGAGDPSADIAGKAVFVLTGNPGVGAAIPDYEERVRGLADRGAVAVIGIARTEEDWDYARDSYRRGQIRLADRPTASIEATMSPAMAEKIFDAAGLDIDNLAEISARADFEPVALQGTLDLSVVTRVHGIAGQNIVARLPGTGNSGEAVVFLAHYDHLGICAPASAADRICNGAVDNASGVAALIEIARGLAAGPHPARDILFVATTAEEEGLLGAKAFAESPPLPLNRIVAAFNLDTVAIAPRGAAVGIVGRGRTALDPLIDEIAQDMGRRINRDTDINNLVERQDGWALLRHRVPTVMVGGSFTDPGRLGRFLSGPYHTPADEVGDSLELGGAAEDVALAIALARAFADPARYPSPPR